MNKFLLFLIPFITAAMVSLSRAQTIVNGDFMNDIVGEASTMSGSVPDIGGDGSPIDDGWIEARPGDDNWDLGSGSATRGGGKDNPFNPLGLAQIFSNPAVGGFANGDTLTYSLEYDFTAYTGTFQAVLYGVTGPRDGTSWATFGGEGMNLNAGVALPAGGSTTGPGRTGVPSPPGLNPANPSVGEHATVCTGRGPDLSSRDEIRIFNRRYKCGNRSKVKPLA